MELSSARLLCAALDIAGPVEPTSNDLGSWIEVATDQRVLPLLYLVVSAIAGVTDAEREMVRNMQLDVMATAVRFEHDLLEVAGVLAAGGVRAAVLKGVSTAHLDYPDPSWRQFADVDLLVAPDDRERAIRLLDDAGWVQAYALPRHHERFTHAITLRNGRRVEVDLHQHIGHRALGLRIPTEALLAAAEPFDLAGCSLLALNRTDRLIHAAIHLLSSRGEYRRLSTEADVLVLADCSVDDAAAVLERAEAWRVRPLVEAALRLAHDEAALALPEGWTAAMARPLHRRDRLVERAYLGARRRPVTEELAYLRLLPNMRDRLDYITGYLTTDPDYAAQHGRRGVRSQARYLWERLRSGPEA